MVEATIQTPPKNSGFLDSLRKSYYNVTFGFRQTSTDELAKLVGFDAQNQPLKNPKVYIFGHMYPKQARDCQELVSEIKK